MAMDRPFVSGVLAIGLGCALFVLGAFLQWWMPEENEGWVPLIAGLALAGLGAMALGRPGTHPS